MFLGIFIRWVYNYKHNTMPRNHILSNIDKFRTVTGKISFNKLKVDTGFMLLVIQATSFLPDTASFTERIYCIEHSITEPVRCKITGDKLKFSPSSKTYNRTKVDAIKNRVQSKCDIKIIQRNIRDNLTDVYKSDTYKKYEPYTIVEEVKLITPSLNITPYIVRKNIDLFCNILNYTKFLPDNTKWGERLYCIKNNITTVQLDIFDEPKQYINSIQGYSNYTSKSNSNQEKRENVISGIESLGFKFYKFNETYKGYLYTADVECNTCKSKKTTLVSCAHWKNIYCPTCYGVIGRSKVEEDICRFLEAYKITIIKNSRNIIPPKELDIYIPDHNLSIELNGILWHSVGSNYPNTVDRGKMLETLHVDKHTSCKLKGIQLLSIFDNEWEYKTDIVKSIILAKLHIFETKLYARKCTIHQITTSEANKFYEQNHLQGGCKQIKSTYCLKYDNDIVCCMSFGSRKITRGEVKNELIRFCNKLNTSVIGGGSKLLKAALINGLTLPLLSYCDKRYGSNKFYESLGFTLVKESPPNYWYTKDCVRLLHRSNFQKHKIATSDNMHMTEKEIMCEAGYRRIYDCGNYVFILPKISTPN